MDDQPPSTVKDLLIELKDASELMVDLAYAAVFFNEEKLADEVIRLDGRSGDLLRRLRTMAMLAARSPEDAEGMAGVLWIADAIQRIGAAASDVARVVAARLGIPDALRPDLRHADEMTARVRVRDEATAIGQTLRELSLPTETGMWVMAIRSENRWEFDPGPEDTIAPGRRAARPRTRRRRQPRARARGRPTRAGSARAGGAGALGARPGGRHPRGDEGPRRGGRRPRLLLDPVQQPGARLGGGRPRGALRPAGGRARELGAARRAGGAQRRRAPRAASGWPPPRSRSATPRAT